MPLTFYWDVFLNEQKGYWSYFWQELISPHLTNYFYWLTGLSVLFLVLELLFPWRKQQAFIRKDFWLDTFYMYFNYFLFNLMFFHGLATLMGLVMIKKILPSLGIQSLQLLDLSGMQDWVKWLTLLVFRDFIQFNIHRLLHRVNFLWNFHKVHHSVEQMGFAAHLRYHWMETIVYRSLEFIPLAMIGFGVVDFFVVYTFTLAVGHFNHANLRFSIGPLKYIFNNPQMHIWHHAKHLPEQRRFGVNFGITFSLWDYLFKTAYIPKSGRDIPLGFENIESFPKSFIGQELYPLTQKNNTDGNP